MKKADVDRMVEEMTANRMRHRTKELAEQAGFVLWPDGQGPFGEVIDWASSYDMELEKFAELVRADERIEQAEKPWVKTYCGGKPNYTTPVQASDILQERVDETAKCGHDWVGLTPIEFNSIKDTATTIGYAIIKTEAMLKEKNCG